MVNKPFWHISDFILTSYTFGCMKMSDFVPNKRYLREVLIFFCHSKKTASEAHRELQKVYGDAALSETTCRDWFRRFKDSDFDVGDRPHEGKPRTFEDAELETLLDEDLCQTQEELGSALGVTCQAISKRLHALGMIKKQGTWVPHSLEPRDVERRFFACEQLLQRKKQEGFSSSHHDGWWKMDSLQQPKEEKFMGTARSCFYVVGSGEYSGCNWCAWAEHCAKNGHNTSRGTKKWFYSMITLGLTLSNPLKPTWKKNVSKQVLYPF